MNLNMQKVTCVLKIAQLPPRMLSAFSNLFIIIANKWMNWIQKALKNVSKICILEEKKELQPRFEGKSTKPINFMKNNFLRFSSNVIEATISIPTNATIKSNCIFQTFLRKNVAWYQQMKNLQAKNQRKLTYVGRTQALTVSSGFSSLLGVALFRTIKHFTQKMLLSQWKSPLRKHKKLRVNWNIL